MAGKIIALEGVSCSGKTTLCENLRKKTGCAIIAEAPLFAGGEEKCPGPANSKEESRRNELFYLEIELARWKEAVNYSKTGSDVLLDRSILSLLTISYALEKTKGFDTFNIAFNDVIKSIRDNKLGLPDLILHLEYRPHLYLERNRYRSNTLSDSWIEKSFNDKQNEFYQTYYKVSPEIVIFLNPEKEIDALTIEADDAIQNASKKSNYFTHYAVDKVLEGLVIK